MKFILITLFFIKLAFVVMSDDNPFDMNNDFHRKSQLRPSNGLGIVILDSVKESPSEVFLFMIVSLKLTEKYFVFS